VSEHIIGSRQTCIPPNYGHEQSVGGLDEANEYVSHPGGRRKPVPTRETWNANQQR
jgi:hypothetical protein